MSLQQKQEEKIMKKIIIAIDGVSGCGKSTVAQKTASVFNYRHIDSGAMYRAVTLYFLEHHVSLTHPIEIAEALAKIRIVFRNNSQGKSEIFLNGVNVEDEIRTLRVAEKVSPVSAIREVRKMLVNEQKKMGKGRGVVMDGRDIGAVVFPDAELKIFLTADMEVRARRRQEELLAKDEMVDLEDIIKNLKKRDHIDTARSESPLTQLPDAKVIDTTFLTIEEEVEIVTQLAMSKIL